MIFPCHWAILVGLSLSLVNFSLSNSTRYKWTKENDSQTPCLDDNLFQIWNKLLVVIERQKCVDGALSKSTGLAFIYIFWKDFFLIHVPVDGCAGEYCLTCKEGWFRINYNKRRCQRKCPKGFYTYRGIQNYCLSKYILFCIITSLQREMLDSIAQKDVSDPAGMSNPYPNLVSVKPLGTGTGTSFSAVETTALHTTTVHYLDICPTWKLYFR